MIYTSLRSGIITMLMLIIYALLLQTNQYLESNLKNLEYFIFALGIYSGQYFYKKSNNKIMSYKEGLQIGSIVSVFSASIMALFNYVYAKRINPDFAKSLFNNVVKNIRNIKNADIEPIQNKLITLQKYLTPKMLVIITFITITIIGIFITMLITLFTSNKKGLE